VRLTKIRLTGVAMDCKQFRSTPSSPIQWNRAKRATLRKGALPLSKTREAQFSAWGKLPLFLSRVRSYFLESSWINAKTGSFTPK
jgi:hypothetical protein